MAGALGVVVFDEGGNVTDAVRLEANGETFGVDLDAGTWHGLVALVPGTVFFETKSGPYVAPAASDRAPWAPAEGDPAAVGAEEALRGLFALRSGVGPTNRPRAPAGCGAPARRSGPSEARVKMERGAVRPPVRPGYVRFFSR